jgi:hypothetical protein
MPTTSSTAQVSEVSKPQGLSQSEEAEFEKQLSLFFIGLEILGEKKKQRFLLYLASLQTHTEQNQETKTDEL